MNDDCLADLMTSRVMKDTELLDPPSAKSLDDSTSLNEKKNAISSNLISKNERNIDQSLDSDEDRDLDCSPATLSTLRTWEQNLQNSHTQPNNKIIDGETTTLERGKMEKTTFSNDQKQSKVINAAAEKSRYHDDHGAVVKHASHYSGQGYCKNSKTMSIRRNVLKSDEKKYNPKSVTLHEIPTFLV